MLLLVFFTILVLTWSKGKQNILSVFDRSGSRISESGYDYVNKYNILHAYVGAQQFLRFLESLKMGALTPRMNPIFIPVRVPTEFEKKYFYDFT